MKKNRIIGAIAALVSTAAVVFSCITFPSVNWPSGVQANSEVELNLEFQLTPETERDGTFLLAFIVPKSWKVAESVEASYSATSLQVKGELISVTDEKMVLANDDTEPTTTMPYSSAMLSQYGVLGNTGPVEWICLRGTTTINTNGGGTHPDTRAYVKIKFKTGANNVKFFTAFVACLTENGFNTANSGEFEISDTQIITVTGGTGNDDYTVLHYVSTTPQTFRYNDYVSIEFVSTIDGEDTPLVGETKVYLNAKAILTNGKTVTGEKVLMERNGDVAYFRYIYPRSYFKLGASDQIENMYVWFTDASGSKVAMDGDEGWEVFQAAE